MVKKSAASGDQTRFGAPGQSPADASRATPHILSWLRLRDDSAMPIYQQLETQLALSIQEGRLQPGVTLPAERYLAEMLGISRTTVQRCYNALRQRRLVVGAGRLGTIVQPDGAKITPGMDRLRGFTQEMAEMGRQPSAKILEHTIVCDRLIASIFSLPSTSRFLKLVRIRYGDEVPLSYETAWYSLEAAPFLEQADVSSSIYAQLAERRMALMFCDQTVEATTPSTFEAGIFGFTEPVPCLLIKRRSYVRRDLMVEYVEGLFRGDSYTYRIRLDA
jgi:GntR family transcriptional regulator